MVSAHKPRCFVAMAFDQDDTEQLYDKSIKPVLKANNVTPVIINRREDNRDINHQIIEQLNTSDFCIADLTYTRPSVYFEAGYAQRLVDVIYTVRSDHLQKNQPEDRRVHFDLQMKPLIRWNKPDDETFRRNLDSRLKNTVLLEWKRKHHKHDNLQKQRSYFENLSIAERLRILRVETLEPFIRLGFNSWSALDSKAYFDVYDIDNDEIPSYAERVHYWMLSTQIKKRILYVVSLRVDESLTLRNLRNEVYSRLINSRYPTHLDKRHFLNSYTTFNKTIEHYVFISIKNTPKNRIMAAMPLLGWNSEESFYTTDKVTRIYRDPDKGKDTNRRINAYFIDNIKSIPEFQEHLQGVLETITSDAHLTSS